LHVSGAKNTKTEEKFDAFLFAIFAAFCLNFFDRKSLERR
jgi:hypothetical protein